MRKGMKFTTLLLALSLLIVGLAGCAGAGNTNGSSGSAKFASIEDIKKNGKIRIGVFADKPPFGYVDSEGKNQGFDVYIAKRFAKDLLGDESKVEFVLV